MFLDFVEIRVRAGDGGDGVVAFRREKYVPRGGPAGGDGGAGGDVVLEADPGVQTLEAFRFRHHHRAGDGGHGSGNRRTGPRGEDAVLRVPLGTVVRDKSSGEVLGELLAPGQRLTVARGGRGGRGNARFRSSVERAPRVAEKGEPGEERWLTLELKLLADVGLVGLPSAGKSSLLARLTAARPKVADYPFTTLHPELGVVVHDHRSYLLADLPGLLEGASRGRGLGHRFLKHAERTRLLVQVVDVGTRGVAEALADVATVRAELSAYDPSLLARAQVFALNKVDLAGARAKAEEVRRELRRQGYQEVFLVSARTGQGCQELALRLAALLAELPPATAAPASPAPAPRREPLRVVAEEDGFRVLGAAVERRVAMTDLDNPHAVARLARYLRRAGVERALRRHGAKAGARVFIRDQEFTYVPDEDTAGEAGEGDE